jgi:nucleoside-diphosphate-sugar epimerase
MSRVFLAGASGAIGQPLSRLLVKGGHQVFGTTRSPAKADLLAGLGVTPIVVDVYDAAKLRAEVQRAHPEIVIHQLTDLPPGLDPARMAEARIANARLRETGTRNLLEAATAAGARRVIAQSIAFAYEPGPVPHKESDPLDPAATGVISLETQVLAFTDSVVLRYGNLYGPGTGFERADPDLAVHVDAAADAAARAVTRGRGVYNIAEDGGIVTTARAKADLGWNAVFRIA